MASKIILLAVFSAIFYVLFTTYSSKTTPFLPSNSGDLLNEFHTWMIKYNKTYGSHEEFSKRYEIFCENYHRVNDFNSQTNKSHTLAMNFMADLTPKEAAAKYAKGHKHGDLEDALHPMILQMDSSSLPSSVDWRKNNAVTPIKDQGHCGACWAFSTIVGIEGLYSIKNNHTLRNFSEQDLIECSHNGNNGGCAGGDPGYGYDFIRMVGIETGEDYPFTGSDLVKCHRNMSLFSYQIKGYVQVTPNDSDQLAAAVAQQPVSICIDGEQSDFLLYSGGIYKGEGCTTNLGHCLAIVGYDSENGVDYWIVKNSYGTDWGENGYIRMLKQSGTGPGICGLTLEALYPTSL